jgi:hypothetical protein
VTTGPFYGGAFNPAAVTVRDAGTITLTANSANTARLVYTIDGVTVTKDVRRQPLTTDSYEGVYAAVLIQDVSSCTDTTKNGTSTYAIGVQIAQSGGAMTIDTANVAGDSCTIGGPYTQAGRNGRVDGNYTCASGDSGSAVVFDLNNRPGQFSGRLELRSSDTRCVTIGQISGIVPD